MPHIKAASEKTPRNKETPRIYDECYKYRAIND